MKRKIIKIDKNLCDGCGLCVEGCREGAIKIIDGKAHVKDDMFCDGLGACLKDCPKGALSIEEREAAPFNENAISKQWPIQLHLVSPLAPFFKGASTILAADCTAFAVALADTNLNEMLKNHSIAIACPKLDSRQEIYIEKITALIDESKINSLTVMIMEVPCCCGLLYIAQEAVKKSARKIPILLTVIGINGTIQKNEIISN